MKNLKHVPVFIAGLSAVIQAPAQDSENSPVRFVRDKYTAKDVPRIYASMGISPLNSYTLSTSVRNAVNIIVQPNVSLNFDLSDYGVAVEYRYKLRNAKAMPADFAPGSDLFFDESLYPVDKVNEWTIYFKRNFYLSAPKVYFTTQLGLNVATVRNATNFQPQSTSSGSWLTIFRYDNYSYDIRKQSAIGLALKTGAVFPLRKRFGFGTYLTGNINKYNAYLGLDLNMMFGYVRK